jgi:hypothetical protein
MQRWPDLDIIDLYIIFVAFHFGLYPFIRGFYFGKDTIFDFYNSNPLAIGLVFLQVIIILAIIRFTSLYFLRNQLNYLKIRHLIEQWSYINKYVLFFIYIFLIMFPFGSYFIYGVRAYIMPADFKMIGKNLPYWFTSIRTIYNCIAFCVFICLFSIILKSSRFHRYLLIILIVFFVPMVTLFGRRYFLNMILIAALFWFIYNQENIFRLKFLGVAVALICAFFLFSNIYQGYRSVLRTVGQMDSQKYRSLFKAMTNINVTLKNLVQRPGTWEFDFLVFDNQLNKAAMTTNGKISWEGFKSAIPRIFWRGKQFGLIDDILAKLYGVNPKNIDIGKNIFGVAQVDFGYYSLIIVPSIMLFIFIIMGGLVKITEQYPTFSWLLSGNIIFYLINIEENGNEIFFMFRNIIIILGLLGIYVVAHKIYLKSLTKAV